MADQIPPAEHKKQIEAYAKEFPDYKIYAEVLDRVLKAACKTSLGEAVIQVRPKSVASFAEKCVRRYASYKDAVNQLTDLCGGRVIVQTLDQIDAVCGFIEQNFEIIEREDVGTRLAQGEFGYRGVHFIVCLKAGRELGITPAELAAIGTRKTEIQVRTWAQHAWADTLHDRLYKTKLRHSAEHQRTGALLAAIMEDGDRNFSRLAGELDGMIANYSAHASKEDVEKEIAVQQLLADNESDPKQKPKIALQLAKLIAAQGEWAKVVGLLEPHAAVGGPEQVVLWLELGRALCHLHRGAPESPAYRQGQKYLQQVIAQCESPDAYSVPNLRKQRSLHARAQARLGWSWEVDDNEAHQAREGYRRAFELEPGNPYYLANMLGFEFRFSAREELTASMRTVIRTALRACREHAAAGTELPAAYFTAGRLSLLLDAPHDALCDYARGVHYCRTGEGFVGPDAYEAEIAWLHRANFGKALPASFQWTKDLLLLAQSPAPSAVKPAGGELAIPVLIVAGGAGSMDAATLARVQPLVAAALSEFHGTVISGGTAVGVPGCVGQMAAELAKKGKKAFWLKGYIPRNFQRDSRYDEIIASGDEHSWPEQILHYWRDLLAAGLKPAEVTLLGFGGGIVAPFEYRLALALGATVGIVEGTGPAADNLLADPLWSKLTNLYPLPSDAKTLRAFSLPPERKIQETVLVQMAQEFHTRYVKDNVKKAPKPMWPWDKLEETYRKANIEQAAYAVRILEAAGFTVRESKNPVVFDQNNFTNEEIELMAELEHGRWNNERLRDGWRFGPRDDAKKIHPCLVPWNELPDGPDGVRRFDRDAVRAFPEILARAGLEVSSERQR